MENAFLVSLSHQMATHRAMEVIANNLANMSTPAFKRESIRFEELIVEIPATEEEGSGTLNVSFVIDKGIVRDISDGELELTNAPLDVAISGPGFFVVQTPEGERYSRNGHFRFDDAGRLVDVTGNPVLSDGGEIAIQPEDGTVHIANDGTVTTALTTIGKLRIVTFENERELTKEGYSLFGAGDQVPLDALEVHLHQGMIEKSNVVPVLEMTNLIEVMRAYQAGAEIMKASEDLVERAIDKLGAVPRA